jgi:hypothetical protein
MKDKMMTPREVTFVVGAQRGKESQLKTALENACGFNVLEIDGLNALCKTTPGKYQVEFDVKLSYDEVKQGDDSFKPKLKGSAQYRWKADRKETIPDYLADVVSLVCIEENRYI